MSREQQKGRSQLQKWTEDVCAVEMPKLEQNSALDGKPRGKITSTRDTR